MQQIEIDRGNIPVLLVLLEKATQLKQNYQEMVNLLVETVGKLEGIPPEEIKEWSVVVQGERWFLVRTPSDPAAEPSEPAQTFILDHQPQTHVANEDTLV